MRDGWIPGIVSSPLFDENKRRKTMPYRLKTCQQAVFSFPCMVPIDCHKRIFYNLKPLNDITFPFFAVPCYLNPPFPNSKYNISHIQMKYFPTKVEHLPNSNAAVASLKRCRCQPQSLSLPNSNTPCPAAEMSAIRSIMPGKNLAGTESAKSAGLWL
jgi:hypothetical protein